MTTNVALTMTNEHHRAAAAAAGVTGAMIDGEGIDAEVEARLGTNKRIITTEREEAPTTFTIVATGVEATTMSNATTTPKRTRRGGNDSGQPGARDTEKTLDAVGTTV